jgi:hypothetical protein
MFSNEEVKQLLETNPNTLTITRSHVSCDIAVQIPEELYKQYKSGEIDRETFERGVEWFVGDNDYTTYEINYFDDLSEMVGNFIEEEEREEAERVELIAYLEAKLAKLKEELKEPLNILMNA